MNFLSQIKLAMLATVALAMVACTSNGTNESDNAEQANVLQVDDVLEQAESLVGDTITLEGVCTHTCKHGARKIFLMGSDDTKTIRIEAGDFGAFKPECVNHIVTVKGIVAEERIDEAYLQAWEAQVATAGGEEHGESKTAGCDTEKKARQETANTTEGRIKAFRDKIAAQMEAGGKDYIAFYHIEAIDYSIEE